jgi:hypothetical protein
MAVLLERANHDIDEFARARLKASAKRGKPTKEAGDD